VSLHKQSKALGNSLVASEQEVPKINKNKYMVNYLINKKA
jgi:hypothetical protein